MKLLKTVYMQNLAKWMGYIEAVNYTSKKAYFKPVRGDDLEFVCHVKDFDPRIHPQQFIDLMNRALKAEAEITVHKKSQKTSAYLNVEAVIEVRSQIHRGIGMDFSRAIVNALTRYVDNLNFKE